MLQPLVIANFKMNPASTTVARALLGAIGRGVRHHLRRVEVVVALPFPYLVLASRPSGLKLGAQNVFWEETGAFTGEVSAPMLRDLGVRYVIIGHSERRRLLGESDVMINRKVKAVLKANLIPVIAIGEEMHESQEVVPPILSQQLSKALADIPKKKLTGIVIAYEPVWAIGTGRAETPDNATRRAIYIRQLLTKIAGSTIATTIRILYGGSVTAKNAAAFLADDIRGMEGLLVGGASLAAQEFILIVSAVARQKRAAIRPASR